jgi:hypothetical protein
MARSIVPVDGGYLVGTVGGRIYQAGAAVGPWSLVATLPITTSAVVQLYRDDFTVFATLATGQSYSATAPYTTWSPVTVPAGSTVIGFFPFT